MQPDKTKLINLDPYKEDSGTQECGVRSVWKCSMNIGDLFLIK